jgi:hypothetical protein
MSDLNITIRVRETGGIARFTYYKEKNQFSTVEHIGDMPYLPSIICSELVYKDIINRKNPTFGSFKFFRSIIDWQIVEEFTSSLEWFRPTQKFVTPTRKDLQKWPQVQVLMDEGYWCDGYILTAIDDKLGFGVFKKDNLNKDNVIWYDHCSMSFYDFT